MKKLIFPLLLLLLLSCVKDPSTLLNAPVKLTCEYIANPSVVDVQQPRFAWINKASEGIRGQRQTAYQIRASSSMELLSDPDIWDSDKVISTESSRVKYNGNTLQSKQDYWWQVRVWGRNDQPSEWSEPASWGMGLLDENEWQATWIGAPWQADEAILT